MGAIVGQIATAGVQTGLNILSDAIASRRQLKHNKSLAAYQFGQNRQLLQEQLAYNTPKAQMERYKDAGLNPNMVLSQGSAGNQSAPLSYPDIKPADVTYGSQLGTMLTDQLVKVRQSELLKTQADLNSVKKDEVLVNKQLKEAQADLVKSNPYLRPEYVSAMVKNLEATAKIKEQESKFLTDKVSVTNPDGSYYNTTNGFIKMYQELDMLSMKYKIQQLSAQELANLIQSQQFNNELQKIQVDWMKNGDITPQHIYQGIMLLLGRLMPSVSVSGSLTPRK